MKKNVFEYYNTKGWEANAETGRIIDESVNVNSANSCIDYNSKTRKRVLNHVNQLKGPKNKILDVASGAVHLPELVEYSMSFKQRTCIDFSARALDLAKINLEKSGQNDCRFLNIDFLNSNFDDGYFDAAISLHTLYHVELNKQEEFVKKIIKSTRKDGVVIIVYSNPFSLERILTSPVFFWQKFKSLIKKILKSLSLINNNNKDIYFKRHNIFWWRRFSSYGEIKISAERTFSASFEKIFIPDNELGKKIFKLIFFIENFNLWKYFSTYYIVVINKR